MIQKLITFVLYFAAEPVTAQSVTRAVRRLDPTREHSAVTASLHKTRAVGRIGYPHLPSRFYLKTTARKAISAETWFNSATWQARKKKLL